MCETEQLIEQLDKKAMEMLKHYGVKRTYLSHDLAQLTAEMSGDEFADLIMQLIRMKDRFWLTRNGDKNEAAEHIFHRFPEPR